jgi:hypothetical protein
VLSFTPDVVILFFFPPNDIADINPVTSLGGARPYFRVDHEGKLTLDTTFSDSPNFRLKRRINWFKQHSALVSLAAERWVEYNIKRSRGRKEREASKTASSNGLSGYLSLCTNQPDETYVGNYEFCKLLIREMSLLCSANEIRFVLVCINDVYVPAVDDYCRKLDPSFDADFFERDLRNLATSIDAEYLGLQGIFKAHYLATGTALHFGEFDPATMNMNGGHWNYDGHKVVAEALARILAQMSVNRTHPPRTPQADMIPDT